jgi:hypothetical protein
MYYDFKAGNNEYKLRLNTRNTIALEKQLGCNPIMIFGADYESLPTVSAMVTVLHASLQAFEHGITLEKAYDIFDTYIEDGNSAVDFAKVILEIYKASGLVPKEVEVGDSEKN